MIVFLPLFLLFSSASASSTCADQLQRCGLLVEEFERQLHDLKNVAFRNCFTNSACVHEKIAFDDCYAKSVRAIRAPFGNSAVIANNDFLNAAEAYRPKMEQCLNGGGGGGGDEVIALMGGNEGGNETGGGGKIDGVIAQLARVVYGTEMADQLWGLPSGNAGNNPLEPEAACSVKKDPGNRRMFGGGISRIVDGGSSQFNNVNTSCTLGASELNCYSQALERDPQYRLLLSSRDKALLSCIQNIRLQPEGNCQFSAPSSRACICNSREELDNRMQSAILDCVQHSPVAQLYAALNSLSNPKWSSPPPTAPEGQQQALALMPPAEGSTRQKPTDAPGTSFQLGEDPISVQSPGAVLTPGTVLNGQCFCATAPKSAAVLASASNDRLRAANDVGGGGIGTTMVVAATAQPAVAVAAVSPAAGVQVYRSLPAMPWYYQPMQTALSAESGIASGFERFFNGQPPLRKKRDE